MNQTDDFLEHFGVKGMKWGVRKIKDARFRLRASGTIFTIRLLSRAEKNYNAKDLDRINNKPEYKNEDFRRPSPLRDKYNQEHRDAFGKRMQEAADSFGTNASGTKKYDVVMDDDGNWDVDVVDVKHADETRGFKVIVTYDNRGHIVSVKMPEGVMEQLDSSPEHLEHFGIKGMRWGVRKDPDHPESEDSTRSAEARTKTKRGGVKVLSNKELQDVISRMNLEQQYSKLNPSKLQRGLNVVKDILNIGNTVNQAVSFANSVGGKIVKDGMNKK